jgi:signal transduction histidine kinase
MDRATRGLLAIARTVLGDLDIEVVLERVLESARELTGARYAALGVLDDSRLELARFVTVGIDEATRREIGPLPRGRGVLGELIGSSTPLRLSNVGRHPHSYGFPAGHPPMKTFLGVPIVIGDQPYGNLYLTDKQGGGDFTLEDEEAAVILAGFAGVAIDHANRFTSSETRRVDLQRTIDALDATLQIAHALGGETDLNLILELVAKRGRALVAARALVIELLAVGELVVAAGAGELPAGLIGQRVRVENTVASATLRARKSQRLHDELNRTRFEQHGIGQLGLDARDALVVPLVFRNQPYGVLIAIDRLDGAEFGATDQRLLEAFAASAATAVATAQSVEEERRHQRLAATEAERSRWARELHDDTLQALANLCLVLGAAHRSTDIEVMRTGIKEATVQIESDIANLRALITDLRPASLDELGIEAALTALAERVTASGLDVRLKADLAWERGRVAVRLIPELEAAIYRIVQESLTNAARHGGAGHAEVELVEDDREIRITVRDEGQGFDPAVKASGFGLAGMHERVELLSGKLVIDSSPGMGTTISVTFPSHQRGQRHRFGQLGTLAAASG